MNIEKSALYFELPVQL